MRDALFNEIKNMAMPLTKTVANILILLGLYHGGPMVYDKLSSHNKPKVSEIVPHVLGDSSVVQKDTLYKPSPVLQDTIETETIAQQLVTKARTFLDRKYDSVYKKGKSNDGLSPYDKVTHKYFVSYKTGRSAWVSEQPLVCCDLVIEAIKKTSPSLLQAVAAKHDKFYLRRVSNIENECQKDPHFAVEKYTADTKASVGDIITSACKDGVNQHMGIVTEVGADGRPTKMIHASYSAEGVIENRFIDFLKNNDYSPVFKISIIDTPTIAATI